MGKDIFEAMSDAIDKMGCKWDKLCGVTMDGAPAMTVKRKGMTYGVRQGEREWRWGCQNALYHPPRSLLHGDMMNTVVKTVNIILAQGLHHREFQAFLSDVGVEYGEVFF